MGSDIRRSDGNFHKNLENRSEYPHKLYIDSIVNAEHFAADSIDLHLLLFTQLFSRSKQIIVDLLAQKQNST